MTQETIQNIVDRISTDDHFRGQFVIALGAKSKEDHDLRQKLLNALGVVSKNDAKNTGGWVRIMNLNLNLERILQLFLSGLLVVLFVVIAVLTFGRIDAPPKGVLMGDRMEMYDPFVRAKELLTSLIPLFTTIVSFWLGFSIQQKKVTQERGKREEADEMMAKIKGRMMVEPEKDDASTLRAHLQEIMETPKPGG